MTDKNRKLWLDTRGVPVITTTKNGEANAIRWGWTEAKAVAADALATRVPVQGEREAVARVRAIHAPGKIIDVWGKSRSQADDFLVCVECTDPDNWWIAYPCATIAALDGAPEPEVAELPETGLEVRDGDGDLIMSGEHRKVLHQGMYVCDSCVNDLGLNVRWDRADRMEGHPLPVEGESKA